MASKGSQGNQDIEGLKARFSQMQQKQTQQNTTAQQSNVQTQTGMPQTSAQQVSQPQQQSPTIPSTAPVQAQAQNPPQQHAPQQQAPQQTQSPPTDTSPQTKTTTPEGTKSPLDALQAADKQQASDHNKPAVNVVEVEGENDAVVGENIVQANVVPGEKVATGKPAEQEAKTTSAIQTNGQPVADETIIEESLEDLREEYDDAKLNSVIIEQVKELIEIDNNLNNKLEDLRVDIKKEVEEREKLNRKVDKNYDELKELEKSIDKFIALYELVTNQFNPFVKQGDQGAKQQMQDLMKDMKTSQTQRNEGYQKNNETIPPQQQAPQQSGAQAQTNTHFETKNGLRVNNLSQLVDALQNMSDEDFAHHVNETKNDFAIWINSALHNHELAQKIMSLKTKQEIIAALTISQQQTQGNAQAQQ